MQQKDCPAAGNCCLSQHWLNRCCCWWEPFHCENFPEVQLPGQNNYCNHSLPVQCYSYCKIYPFTRKQLFKVENVLESSFFVCLHLRAEAKVMVACNCAELHLRWMAKRLTSAHIICQPGRSSTLRASLRAKMVSGYSNHRQSERFSPLAVSFIIHLSSDFLFAQVRGYQPKT